MSEKVINSEDRFRRRLEVNLRDQEITENIHRLRREADALKASGASKDEVTIVLLEITELHKELSDEGLAALAQFETPVDDPAVDERLRRIESNIFDAPETIVRQLPRHDLNKLNKGDDYQGPTDNSVA
jgi:hypothetical protein